LTFKRREPAQPRVMLQVTPGDLVRLLRSFEEKSYRTAEDGPIVERWQRSARGRW
jgi:hypothetical protein